MAENLLETSSVWAGRVGYVATRGRVLIPKRHETCRIIKAAMNCRNPKARDVPRYQSGTRRAAIQNILKRRETRRTPKGRDVQHFKL